MDRDRGLNFNKVRNNQNTECWGISPSLLKVELGKGGFLERAFGSWKAGHYTTSVLYKNLPKVLVVDLREPACFGPFGV